MGFCFYYQYPNRITH